MFKAVLLSLVTLSLLACQQGSGTAAPVAPVPDSAGNIVLATIEGTPITEQDIEGLVSRQLQQVRQDLYDARKQGVDQLIDEKLLEAEAKKKGIAVEELLNKQIRDQIKVTEKELKAFYEERKQRFQGRSYEEAKPLVESFLEQQKFAEARADYLGKLRKQATIAFHIEPPRVVVEAGAHPSIGPNSAPVKMVEFSDFQCPFCGKARETVNQVIDAYGKKVQYIFRDFPLSFHKDSFKAHEAGHCADDQGKFWEYNRKLFSSQRDLTLDDLKKYASELHLNTGKFEQCLSSGKYTQKVQESLNYGQSVGVSGTPAFFINGRMVSGARPFESFKEIIDDELSRLN